MKMKWNGMVIWHTMTEGLVLTCDKCRYGSRTSSLDLDWAVPHPLCIEAVTGQVWNGMTREMEWNGKATYHSTSASSDPERGWCDKRARPTLHDRGTTVLSSSCSLLWNRADVTWNGKAEWNGMEWNEMATPGALWEGRTKRKCATLLVSDSPGLVATSFGLGTIQ